MTTSNVPMTDNMKWSEPPNVLAVDDELAVCESIRRVLSLEGYRIDATTSSLDALARLSKESIDLLLVDIKMPDMDGIELLRQARAISPETEVVIITGYATIETAVEAIKLGAFDYLEKPVSPPQLIVAAARALERRHLIDLTRRLRSEIETRHRIGNVICSSPAMRRVMQLVEKVASANSTVLIAGETGTGKDVIARAIHYNSPRHQAPFVVVDCASLTDSLLESELFGHVRGAFTGAVKDRKGLAETARGGTLFLDEISTVSPHLQGSLLRLIQEHEIRPVGSDKNISVDVRVIAATNRSLTDMVKEQSFREDLYYRLSVFTINLPPLRERREEIPLLAHHFMKRFSEELGTPIDGILPQAMAVLEAHDWPGNVRELENVIERAVLLADKGRIGPQAIPLDANEKSEVWSSVPDDARSLAESKKELRVEAVENLDRLFVLKALRAAEWNVTAAAQAVGMQRPNFHALMRKAGISARARSNGGDSADEG